MPIILILVVLFSGGVTYKAESSLPGDALYSLKVSVNENVRSAFSLGAEAKSNWTVRVAERRLEESESLAAEGRMESSVWTKLESNFDAQATRVEARVKNLEENGSVNAAADLASNFETSLRAHALILAKLAADKPTTSAQVGQLLAKVRISADKAENSRVSLEAKVGAGADSEASAKGKLTAAQNKISEVTKFVAANSAKASAEAKLEAEARLKLAGETLVAGKAKLEAKAYAEAFALFSRAMRLAQEAKLLLVANSNMTDASARVYGQLKVEIGGEERGTSTEKGDRSTSSSANVELKTEGRGNSASSSAGVKTEVKIQVGQ